MVPNGVSVDITDGIIAITGPKGSVKRRLTKLISVSKNNTEIVIECKNKALRGTWEAHINNMIKGVTSGFLIQLKTIHAHFPMAIKVSGKDIRIENFLGEKKPRAARVMGDTKIEVKGQDVTLSGPNKEDVGNTYTSLRRATRIRFKDGRVFQDGIYKV